jgi:hypothetical protein
MQNQPNNTPLQKLANWRLLVVILVCINIGVLLYAFFGFGTVKIEKPDNANTYLNENFMGNKESLQLRPGTYTIRISGSGTSAKTFTVSVYPFTSKTVIAEATTPLNIFKEATGTPYFGGEYKELESVYIKNDWLVARYEQTKNANVITVAFRFAYDKWNVVAYYPNSDSDESLTTQINRLPTEVANTFNEIRRVRDED